MQKLWELAKENLTREEIKNDLLLATDGTGQTDWDVALYYGNLNAVQKLWELDKENLTT
jgi:hypothetical protein